MPQRLQFIGTTTAGSGIMRIFPSWAEALGLDAEMQGVDLPLHAGEVAYREAVSAIRSAPAVRGALVTSHKVDVYAAASDLFDEIDPHAKSTQEVSCIAKRDSRLIAFAKDPVVSRQTLDAMLGADYWHGAARQVLCFGAGGAGSAITVALHEASARPDRVIVTDVDPTRLKRLRSVHEAMSFGADVEYREVSSVADSDALLESLPGGSLVINATGLGKDAAGSPVSDAAVFPPGAVVWELNYRGTLEFLGQAARQALLNELILHDGWQYFLNAWKAVIAEVFQLTISPDLAARLSGLAEPLRPSTLAWTSKAKRDDR
jgi:shikimate 5-dehydrogenase